MPTDVARLDGLRIGEVSGVDHPAHLSEGWMVLKSATGLSDEDLAEVVAEAKELAKAQSPSPSQEVVMTDTTTAVSSDDDEMLKSLPEPVRKAFEQQRLITETAMTELRKERETRADGEAITKARDEFSNIPDLDPTVFGPAMRKAAEAAPEETAVLLKALSTANAALAESALLKEVGSSVTPAAGGGGGSPVAKGANTSAFAHATEIAKAALASGDVETVEQGIAKAFTDNPDLYSDYINEQRG